MFLIKITKKTVIREHKTQKRKEKQPKPITWLTNHVKKETIGP